jgi:hypothetical protein
VSTYLHQSKSEGSFPFSIDAGRLTPRQIKELREAAEFEAEKSQVLQADALKAKLQLKSAEYKKQMDKIKSGFY